MGFSSSYQIRLEHLSKVMRTHGSIPCAEARGARGSLQLPPVAGKRTNCKMEHERFQPGTRTIGRRAHFVSAPKIKQKGMVGSSPPFGNIKQGTPNIER